MAKTKKKGKTTKAAKVSNTSLPKGFTPIAGRGQSWPNENTKPGDMIQGTIVEYDEVTVGTGKKKRDVQIAKIETPKGHVYTVWESAGNGALFEYEVETEVAIIFDGYGKAKGGNNPPKLFRMGVKEG